ncbi:MAG: decaprenyl-phosphate phosphoribosyltransferase [Anaerolineae bacterium]|nr:decaprenyl-phosphate phosphoribosyltransferase [Anaerolineae bacterium]
MLIGLLKTMRPKQWTKNVFVFAALIFDKKLFHPVWFSRTLAAFLLFCLISGTVYLINDVVDLEKDRRHPEKRKRPLPSGQLSPQTAIAAAVVFGAAGIGLSFLLDLRFGVIALLYLASMVLYSFVLKHLVIIDIMTIAAGFVLRVAAGVVVIPVERFSPWLYVCTTLLALFMAASKRRHELVLLAESANNHRRILDEYNIEFLDDIIALVTSTTVIAYSLYTFSAPNLPANHAMMLTIPFVLYGLFRYLYLVRVKGLGGAPEDLLLKDIPLLLDVVGFGLAAVLILYIF